MSITDEELLLLERLLNEDEIDKKIESLTVFDEFTSPNYKALVNGLESQVWGKDKNGKPILESGIIGQVLEGSSRSRKTWAGIFFILRLTLIKHKKDGCTINIYRETYNEFKTTLYDDFKRILPMFGLHNKFETTDEVKSFKIGKSKIHFLGDGKHGGGCDYAFFNEMMSIKRSVFDQVEMRCRVFWWGDYNPSFTQHWVFTNILKRSDVGFLRTTYKDNPFISPVELNKIKGYDPWEEGSYQVTDDGKLMYNGQEISDKNQPPPNTYNVQNGTADLFMHKVYALGLRGAMKGVIFPNVTWIQEFPSWLSFTWGMDFGFTADPTTLVKYARDGSDVYLQLFLYKPIDNSPELDATLSYLKVSKYTPITADSSDRYVSEKHGVVRMVNDLFELGWEINKVSKTKGKVYWIQDLKRFKIHIVETFFTNPKTGNLENIAKIEQENYVWAQVNGEGINHPVDGYDHFWDGALYAHMSYDSNDLYVDSN